MSLLDEAVRDIMRPAARDPNQYGFYTPEDRMSALEMAKGAASSGIELLGDVLDTFGGRAIKGYLGGKPRELLSVLPFSDYAGITDPQDKVSGEDLARQWGLASGNRWGDLATGAALDLALDPTSYLFGPGAALTKGGRVAKAAGLLPSSVRARQAGTLGGVLEKAAGPGARQSLEAAAAGTASILPESALAKASQAAKAQGVDILGALDEPLGGLFGVGLPLGENPLGVFGTGTKAMGFANKLGDVSDWVGKTLPVRALTAMFNKGAEGRISEPLQTEFLNIAPRKLAAQETGERYGLNLARQLDELGMNTAAGQRELALAATGQQSSPQLGGIAKRYADDLAAARQGMIDVGIGVGKQDMYLPRTPNVFEPTPGFERGGGLAKELQGISPVSPNITGRVEPYASQKGVGEIVDLMYNDPRLTSPYSTVKDPIKRAQIIRQEYLGFDPAVTAEYSNLKARSRAGQILTDAESSRLASLEKTWQQGDEWQNILRQADPKYAALGPEGPTGAKPEPFYDPDVVKGAAMYMKNAELVKLRAEGIMRAVGKDAVPAAQAPLDYVSLPDVFQKIGMTGAGAESYLAKIMQDIGNQTGAGLKDLKISRPLARDLEGYITPFTRPSALDPFVRTIDTIQAVFKAGVTSIWPKKYIRDAVQGGYLNFATMSPAEFAQYETTAANFVKNGGVIEFANKVPGLENLSPEKATLKLADEFAALDGFYTGRKSRYAEEAGGAGFVPKELPGRGREGISQILTPDASRQTTWNLRDIAGFWGREETKFAPVVAGGKISELIDETNKFALFLQRRMNGFSTGAAWEDVLKRHYDYSNLSGFETSVMRRVFPFYSWMRQNIPATLTRLIDRPGGVEALTAKTIVGQRTEDFVPEYAGEGLAIPLSPEDQGVQRFLGRAGLQFEDALKNIGDIGSIKMLGGIRPDLKVGLELATGRQLHTGRPLEDVQPIVRRGIVDELLTQSGLPGRAITTLAPLIRPFKDDREFTTDDLTKFAINATAPFSITDVDMEKARETAIRGILEGQLKGAPNVASFERYFVRPENVPNLTPEQLMLLRVYNQQQGEAAARRRIGVRRRRED